MQCCCLETDPMPAPASMIVYPVVERVTAQLLSANARSLLALLACFDLMPFASRFLRTDRYQRSANGSSSSGEWNPPPLKLIGRT